MATAERPGPAKRALCRYDSPGWLGKVLMDAIGEANPRSILDLGSGGGVLSLAALARWNASELVTVDVDAAAGDEIRLAVPSEQGVLHRHLLMDLMSPLPEDPVGVRSGSVDLVISNPPYRTARWTPELETILALAGLPAPATVCGDVPVDLIFLAQALRLVRAGGSLGLILPDSIVSGTSMAPFRRALTEQHRVVRVIQLPRRAFKGTDAQAYVVIVQREGISSPVRLDRLVSEGAWLAPIYIGLEAATERMDHCFHSQSLSLNRDGCHSLRALGVEVRRGALSSIQIAASTSPTFHTTDFPDVTGASISLPKVRNKEVPGVWASPGDILLARVDRRLQRKIALVSEGEALVSDCVLRLRCPSGLQPKVLEGLLSDSGQAQIIGATRGTGPRHISVRSLMEIVV